MCIYWKIWDITYMQVFNTNVRVQNGGSVSPNVYNTKLKMVI